MPGRAPSGRLGAWHVDPAECIADLDAFERLLAAKSEVSERDDILPFFREHPHLAAFLGTYAPTINTVDQVGVEVRLFGQFVTDVVAGNREKKAYCTRTGPQQRGYRRVTSITTLGPACD